MVKENKYLVDKKYGKFHLEVIFPSYQSLNKNLGYYWNFGVSLSVGKYSFFSLHVGLIFGSIVITKYI